MSRAVARRGARGRREIRLPKMARGRGGCQVPRRASGPAQSRPEHDSVNPEIRPLPSLSPSTPAFQRPWCHRASPYEPGRTSGKLEIIQSKPPFTAFLDIASLISPPLPSPPAFVRPCSAKRSNRCAINSHAAADIQFNKVTQWTNEKVFPSQPVRHADRSRSSRRRKRQNSQRSLRSSRPSSSRCASVSRGKLIALLVAKLTTTQAAYDVERLLRGQRQAQGQP